MSVHVTAREFELAKPIAANVESELSIESITALVDRRMTLSVAETREEKAGAAELLNRRFGWRGYGSDHKIGGGDHNVTFVAQVDDEIIGTITLGVDNADGLGIDPVFKDEIDKFRGAPGALVCELKKFAFEMDDKDYSNSSLACLFHAVFLYGMHKYDCTDLFIEVNPRHKRFYQAMLGFTPVGELRTNESVGAPSQLMWLNVSDVAEHIAHHRAGAGAIRSRSLYSLFLSEAEEAAVRSHLDLRRNFPGMNRCLVERSMPAKELAATAN